jgi:ubiquinone/menaquinone biosynthesis C-methylase UbiE
MEMRDRKLLSWSGVARLLAAVMVITGAAGSSLAQEDSVNPGINERFMKGDAEDWVGRFERDNREIYTRRDEIVAVLGLQPGMDVADIGAGSGFFTLLFAEQVGPDGIVYALDIAENFVEHIGERARAVGLTNVKGIVNPADSTGLEPASVDVVFLAHTYHHFEFPYRMLESIRSALRTDGTVVLVEFERVEGVSPKFVLNMVRAGKGVFTDEFRNAGFELVEEVPFSEKDYILKFRLRPE